MPSLTRPVALLDLDGTLHEGTLGAAVLRELLRSGAIAEEHAKAALDVIGSRSETSASFNTTTHQVYAHYSAAIQGLPHHALVDASQRAWAAQRNKLFGFVRPLLRELSTRGYVLALISGSPHEAVMTAAEDLGIPHFCGAQIAVTAGLCEGGLVRAPGLPGAKVRCLTELAKTQPLDLPASLALGNTASDIGLLEAVGYPFAFEPDEVLAAAAQRRGWTLTDRNTALGDCRLAMTGPGRDESENPTAPRQRLQARSSPPVPPE